MIIVLELQAQATILPTKGYCRINSMIDITSIKLLLILLQLFEKISNQYRSREKLECNWLRYRGERQLIIEETTEDG